MIALNETEQRLAKHIADRRFGYCRTVSAKATVYGAETAEFRELNSISAEIAFCKYQNIYPDITYDKFGDHDCRLSDGRSVDVKCTTLQHGQLMVKQQGAKLIHGDADLFALMVGKFPVYRFAGWMDREALIQERRLNKKIPHPAYCARQDELYDY